MQKGEINVQMVKQELHGPLSNFCHYPTKLRRSEYCRIGDSEDFEWSILLLKLFA
jgi:hypothetical protein